MADSTALADQLQQALVRAGITQAELARRAGVTRAYVGRLLTGTQAAPTLEVVEALANALGMSAVDHLRLAATAGVMPPAVATVLADTAVAGALVALTNAPPEQREDLQRLLTRLQQLAAMPEAVRLVITLCDLPAARQAHLRRLMGSLVELVEETTP